MSAHSKNGVHDLRRTLFLAKLILQIAMPPLPGSSASGRNLRKSR
jgi:hypothetical protein